jgi:hypothetical protein
MCRVSTALRANLQRLRIMSRLKRLNHLAWRIRRQLSVFIRRLSTSVERRRPEPQAEAPREATSVTDEVSPTMASASPEPVPQPNQERFPPLCHPDYEPNHPDFHRPALEYRPKRAPFHQFALLPTELRLLIWHFASHLERIIEIQWASRTTGFKLASSPRGPAILQVNHESRTEALKCYRRYFGTKKLPKAAYVNPVCDIIFFRNVNRTQTWRCIWGPNSLWHDEMKNVRRIAVLGYGRRGWGPSVAWVRRTVGCFAGLEELIVLWGDGEEEGWSREGRGANYIERLPCAGNSGVVSFVGGQVAMEWEGVEEAWIAGRWWERYGRKKLPVLSLRHWCMRVESEW